MLKRKIAAAVALSAMLVQPVFAQDISVMVNGAPVEFTNQQPTVVEGRTLIPLRGVFEKLGYVVTWDGNTKTATLQNDNYTINIQAGGDTFTVNSNTVTPDVPAQIINGSMMIPLRAISEGTGVEVSWDAATKTASINDNKEIKAAASELPNSPLADISSDGSTMSTPFGNLTLNDAKEILEYAEGYQAAVAPMADISSKLADASKSGDLEQMKAAFKQYKNTAADVRAKMNALNPPEACKNIHDLTMQALDLIDEVVDFFLNIAEDPTKITANDITKVQEYMTRLNSLQTQMQQEVQKWQSLSN